MISIVICSRTSTLPPQLTRNLGETIGCAHEILVVDNSANTYSIFEAYNIGIDRSQGDFICFMHDDILLRTQNWGNIAMQIFDDNPKLALLGVAGARIKTRMPSAWWNCAETLKPVHILQHWNHGGQDMLNSGFGGENLCEVAVMDGVFMLVRKSANLRFDERLKGFHNYDLNISIASKSNGFENWVTNQILVEHFSSGTINDSWYDSTLQLHELYADKLPVFAKGFNDAKTLSETEFANGKQFADRLWLRRRHKNEVFKIWRRLFRMRPFSVYQLKVLKRIATSAFSKNRFK